MTTSKEQGNSVETLKVATQPGMGKWNRQKRMKARPTKAPISKAERREKYMAIAKDRQIRSKSKNLVCYNCRESGHSIQHCPKAPRDQTTKSKSASRPRSAVAPMACLCYKCGSTEHALAACPKKSTNDDELPFATCFVCHGKGHLASGCPNNTNGIYVNGGECKHCGSKQHRGTHCPDKKTKEKTDKHKGRIEEQDFSDLLDGQEADQKLDTPTNTDSTLLIGKKRRVVNF